MSTQGMQGRWRKPRSLSFARLNDHRAMVIMFGLAAILVGLSGMLLLSAYQGIGESLAEALPQVFPSPTPTRTSTPTAQEWVALYLAEADGAWQGADVETAIQSLEHAYALEPDHDLVAERLFVARASLGLYLADAGESAQALEYLDLALEVRPDNARVRQARDMARGYLDALRFLEEDDPGAAAKALEAIWALHPGYLDTTPLLHRAHYEYGLALQAQGLLYGARAAYIRALEIAPGEHMAQVQLREVDYLLATPTPTATYTPTPSPTPTATPVPVKRIVVQVSTQRFRVYENDQLKWDFACSTGRPGTPTRRGTFAVQSKIKNAWGGTWSIWMPYWLGIYWAGGTENGIHALPVSLDGSVLWAGYLGTPISFGCIVLDTYAASLVYEWADIGTPVIIRD